MSDQVLTMWQSQVEMECSIVYFDHIMVFKAVQKFCKGRAYMHCIN